MDIQIPLETVTEISETGAAKQVERKVFPGYVLIKMTYHFALSDIPPAPLTPRRWTGGS